MDRRTNAVDMHCDTISRLWEYERKGKEAALRKNRLHIDLERLQKRGYLVQNFALFVHLASVEDPWEQVLDLYRVYCSQMEQNQDLIAPALCYEDIERNRKLGKVSALLTVEEGAVCKGELEKLCKLQEMGVRMMTLTWNFANELGFPNVDGVQGKKLREAMRELKKLEKKDPQSEAFLRLREDVDRLRTEYLNVPNATDGLTEKGKEFVCKMEELSMIPDVSHLSDAGFWDVAACCRKPFVASHSNARAVCPHVRNLTDEMIRALAERGGVMGLNFCADFLAQKPMGVANPGTIADIVAHAKHIAKVGGVGVLGLGSDFDGIDTHKELRGAQGMDRLADALRKGGFTSSEVDQIFFENVLRVYRDTL